MRRTEPGANSRAPGRAAFTLVEVVAVLVLLALLGVAGAVSLRSALQDAAVADAAAELRRQDQLLRDYAVRTGRLAQLELDGSRRRVGCVDAATGQAVGRSWEMPRGLDVRWVVASTRGVPGDVTSIECSTRGQTPSYAVRLEGPGPKRQQWLVAGLTGQINVLRDEADATEIFALLPGAAAGDDAD